MLNPIIPALPTPPSSAPAAESHTPQAKRARLERARALVIAQFGARILVDPQPAAPHEPAPPPHAH